MKRESLRCPGKMARQKRRNRNDGRHERSRAPPSISLDDDDKSLLIVTPWQRVYTMTSRQRENIVTPWKHAHAVMC